MSKLEVIKKNTKLMDKQFSCDECGAMMFRGEQMTATSIGERYKRPDGTKGFTNVSTTFRCSKCEPIKQKLTPPPPSQGGDKEKG